MFNKGFKKLSIFLFLFIFMMQSTIVHAIITDNQIVDKAKVWTINFTQEVVLDEANKQSITVKDSKGSIVTCALSLGQDNKSIVVNPPTGGYIAGEKYVLNIGNDLQCKSGKKIKSAKIMNFTIKNEVVSSTGITFPDKNLEQVIRDAIKKPTGDILKDDVEKITKLIASKKNITDLSGIENLTNVTYLDLSSNQISNISALGNLTSLNSLSLFWNQISDISALGNLKALTSLEASRNQISDISVLGNLKALTYLSIEDNQISNIDSLKNLTNLQILDIIENHITDISALENCKNLVDLNLTGNTINPTKEWFSNFKKLKWVDYIDLKRCFELYDKMDEIIKSIIKPGMSELEKEKAVHDYIVLNATYALNSSSDQYGGAYAILVDGTGVCGEYVLATQALLNRVGIECVNVKSSKMNHEWCIVKIDGNYYHLDTTWDDPVPDKVGVVRHTYFNLTDSEMSKSHNWEYHSIYPVCNTTYTIANVSLNKTTDILGVGGTDTLEPAILPTNAAYKNVIWTSSDATIANVDTTGKVTALKVGTATITATSVNESKTATCKVIVNPSVNVTSVSLNKTTDTLTVGGTDTLTATILPTNATSDTVTWATSDTTIAKVDATGNVTAIEVGTATITATTTDGGKTDTCKVIVNPAVSVVPVTAVSLNKTTDGLTIGDIDMLTAIISPVTATNKIVTWTTSDTTIAKVDATGKVTGINIGTATITATSVDGSKMATCNVTVDAAINLDSDFTFDASTGTITKYIGTSIHVSIPSKIGGVKVSTIGSKSFQNNGISTITIPNSVTSIGAYAFAGCNSLTSITIPSNVTSIGGYAFEGCKGMNAIIVDPANINYASEDGVLFNKAKTQLVKFPITKSGSYTIPNSVTSIMGNSFSGCKFLTSIIIPSSVKSIKYAAFQTCSGITSIAIPSSATSIEGYAFSGCSNLDSAYFYGNAPRITSSVFISTKSGFVVYYKSGKTGFTNPWNGYETKTFLN